MKLLGGARVINSTDHEIKATDDFISKIAKCLADAVGDDIKVNSYGLITQNGTPFRVWDLLNTKICKLFDKSDVIANPTKRGAWLLVPVFERNTGVIYSLMRETRFAELKKELPKRRSAHYIDAFASALNGNLHARHVQLTFFTIPSFNKNHLREIVQKILSDLKIPNELVKRHALILFRSANHELSSLRCCIVNSNLDIVNESDWCNYIKPTESAVPDTVDDKTSLYADPTVGMQYKQKAKDKMEQRILTEEKNADNESHDIE